MAHDRSPSPRSEKTSPRHSVGRRPGIAKEPPRSPAPTRSMTEQSGVRCVSNRRVRFSGR
jgi:hypothetical protein